ncbi:MAG TPA: hypothetical protein VI685_06635 [Candidatus Angelobacter sp.]
MKPTGDIQWKQYRRLAMPLSFVAGVGISLLAPLGLLFFVASIVFLVGRYRRDHQGPLRPVQGAKLGAFNGLITFVVAAAMDAALFHEAYRQQIMLGLQKQFGGNPDPKIQQFVHWVGTNQGLAFFVAFSLILGLAIFLIVSSFIGAISVSFSSNRDRR